MTQASGNLQKVEADKDFHASQEKANKVNYFHLQSLMQSVSQFFIAHFWILCVLIGGIALSLNLYQLGNRSLWFDEILSVTRAQQSLPVLLQIIANTQPNMAFYYVLLHFWLSFTSLSGLNPTEFVVRLPSAIFAAFSSIMVFLLARRFLSITAGVVSVSIYLLNGLQLIYAQETRSYALQLLLICISWYALFFLFTADAHQKRWWLVYSIATILAIYTQLFSSLILGAQAMTFTGLLLLPGPWRVKVRQQLHSFIVSLLSIGIVISPLLYASRYGSKTGWLPIPHPLDIYVLFLNISADSKIYLVALLTFAMLGLCAALLAYSSSGVRILCKLTLAEEEENKRFSRLQHLFPIGFGLLCWLIIPIILSYGVSQGSLRLFSSRYLVTIVPPLVLLVGLGTTFVRWRAVQIVLTLGLLLLTLYYVPRYYQTPQAEDWNSTSFWLEQHYQANDGLVCYDNAQGCQVCIEYYLTAYPSDAHFTTDSPGSFAWVNYDLTNHLGNAQPAVNPKFLAIFAAHHPHIFYIVGRISRPSIAFQAQSAQHWLDIHYHFIAQIVTRTVTIRQYATS
ncbi:MAG: hypothetical protein NVS4B7_04020 [Ktedonobacteraceae bacterium]